MGLRVGPNDRWQCPRSFVRRAWDHRGGCLGVGNIGIVVRREIEDVFWCCHAAATRLGHLLPFGPGHTRTRAGVNSSRSFVLRVEMQVCNALEVPAWGKVVKGKVAQEAADDGSSAPVRTELTTKGTSWHFRDGHSTHSTRYHSMLPWQAKGHWLPVNLTVLALGQQDGAVACSEQIRANLSLFKLSRDTALPLSFTEVGPWQQPVCGAMRPH